MDKLEQITSLQEDLMIIRSGSIRRPTLDLE